MRRKKPEGSAWDKFVQEWQESDHDGKVELAKDFGVSYETCRHWVSDSGAGKKPAPSKTPKMTVTIPELLAMRPSVELDFCSFDIETSNLNADFSIMLTACLKPYGKDTIVFRADNYPEWTKDRANDYRIVKAVAEELRKHAVIITHYGLYFDIPFMRAKMVKHNLEPLPQMFAIDTWAIAKKSYKVSSRRLKNLVSFFDVGEKEPVEGPLWMKAAYDGDKEAMDKIVEHNIRDVEVLERLACLSFPYLRSIPKL
jgi:uncharacterized protein YprB with RNaseH-like and TPR domain